LVEWSQGNLIFKEREKRRDRKKVKGKKMENIMN